MYYFSYSIMRFSVAVFAALTLNACAKSASEVQPVYVSPLQYEEYSCKQLAQEAQRISYRAAQLSGVQDNNADEDALVTAAAIVVFWPAAFLVGGDDQTTAELARMKGEFETIEKVAIKKECGLDFQKGKTG